MSNVRDNHVFDIKEKLATGSFGSTVFKAYNAALGRVAIAKKYPASATNDYDEFMKLLDIVRRCNCNHIVGIHGYYKAAKCFWVVMEYCHGYSVAELMERLNRPLKESHIRTILSHILKGLEVLHSRNIVHARIKANNILITTYGVCKLAEPSPTVRDSLASMDSIVDNSYWTAPEVLQQHVYSNASDIWSIGITMIEMAEQHPPYAETHPSRVAVTIPTRPPPTLINPDAWSKSLKGMLSQCLRKNPNDRCTTTDLLAQKIIKKADSKGIQGILQKSNKLQQQQQNSRFYTEDSSKKSNKGRSAEDVPPDDMDSNWAHSGTLVWNPTASESRSKSLTRTAPQKPDLKQSKSSPISTRGRSLLAQPANKVPLHRNTKPGTTSQASKPISKTPAQTTHETNNFAECDSDTMKRGNFAEMKSSFAKSSVELPEICDGPVTPVPKLSKASERVQSKQSPEKKPNESYPEGTVTLKNVEGYTPSYMDVYRDVAPPLVNEEELEEDEEEEVKGTLARRNSIDERGRNQEEEELKEEAKKIDQEYCNQLNQLKEYCQAIFLAITEQMERIQVSAGTADWGQLDFYKKLNSSELSLMFDFIDNRHGEHLKEVKQHYDLQHRFLMDAMRTTPDSDQEERYRLGITENNEEKSQTIALLNRSAQSEKDEILKAIERINFASAIADE